MSACRFCPASAFTSAVSTSPPPAATAAAAYICACSIHRAAAGHPVAPPKPRPWPRAAAAAVLVSATAAAIRAAAAAAAAGSAPCGFPAPCAAAAIHSPAAACVFRSAWSAGEHYNPTDTVLVTNLHVCLIYEPFILLSICIVKLQITIGCPFVLTRNLMFSGSFSNASTASARLAAACDPAAARPSTHHTAATWRGPAAAATSSYHSAAAWAARAGQAADAAAAQRPGPNNPSAPGADYAAAAAAAAGRPSWRSPRWGPCPWARRQPGSGRQRPRRRSRW